MKMHACVLYFPVLLLLLGSIICSSPQITWNILEYDATKVPADNPMKGFMPYVGEYEFPHSLEYFYIGMAEIVVGQGQYNWDLKMEPTLNEVASRGHQAVFRVYLEYPRRPLQVPQFILDAGITLTPYEDHGGGTTPDFDFPLLVDTMLDLIAEMGKRYDGDPRVGFIEVGMLGHWGEFHSWPTTHLFASAETQNKVLDAYEQAFKTTPMAVSQDIFAHEPMARIKGRRIGLHDDVFTRATLQKQDEHFYARVVRYGMTDHWKKVPIGGEITPGQQSAIWDVPSGVPDDYYECIEALHPSWLLNQRAFTSNWDEEKTQRAIAGSRALGYEFHVSEYATVESGGKLRLIMKIRNTGAAPFYYAWPSEVALLKNNAAAALVKPDWDIRTIIPGEESAEFKCDIPLRDIAAGSYKIAFRIPNPLPNAKSIHMANSDQGEDWLILGEWEKKSK